ncbi:TonB-dependent receptor [candidate division KSB1 bacterium]|nr:TonB-dependent receptor [candidate division KSB1 bacterium]
MLKKLIPALIVVLLLVQAALPQAQRPRNGAMINGAIYDQQTNNPIEYANIILFSQRDRSQVTGTISDDKGSFQLKGVPPGAYYIEIRFMGYEIKEIENIRVNPRQPVVDLGKIELEGMVLSMETVAVEGEKPALTYEIDKKVIAVSQVQTAISGNAADVLENVPSVTVDIEGNVTLRGSSNFQVLIDGRPTVLEPNDALQQIPASTIENIEIITNPSAKYDPDGTAGIINLVMKKNQRSGRSGLLNLNSGLNDKYGGELLLENRNNKYSIVLGLDYNRRFFEGTGLQENRTIYRGLTSFINSDGDSERGYIRYGLRGGLEWNLSPKDNLQLDGRYGYRSHEHESDENYDKWAEPDLIHNLYTSNDIHGRSGTYYSTNLSYRRKFGRQGHELTAQLRYSKRNGDEESVNELIEPDGAKINGHISSEEGPSQEYRTKVDYTLPFNEDDKFEAGYQSEFDDSKDIVETFEYQPDQDDYVFLSDYAHTTRYIRNTHSLYAIYSTKISKFGFQGGLRGEYTDRSTELVGENEKYVIDRWDYFPTAHFSYEFSRGRQLMASYTRRIDRPRGYYLEPFLTWSDAYNVRRGNPAIEPEYIDSYEMGFQTSFGKNLFSTELYYRKTNNKIERVRSVYDVDVTLHSVENVGTDYSLGTELLLNIDVTKFWNINLMGNIYQYRIEGELFGDDFSRQSDNWSTRFNNVFKLGRSTQLQINNGYRSPTVRSQGRREGFFSTDLAVKQEFFERALSLSLQIRDVFGQRKYESISEGPNFYIRRKFDIESPIVMLNIRYNINNYRTDRDRSRNRGQADDMEGGEDF